LCSSSKKKHGTQERLPLLFENSNQSWSGENSYKLICESTVTERRVSLSASYVTLLFLSRDYLPWLWIHLSVIFLLKVPLLFRMSSCFEFNIVLCLHEVWKGGCLSVYIFVSLFFSLVDVRNPFLHVIINPVLWKCSWCRRF
jgi:hypothetical protein